MFTEQFKLGNLVKYTDPCDKHGIGNGAIGIVTEKINRHGRYGVMIGYRTIYIQHWLLERQ